MRDLHGVASTHVPEAFVGLKRCALFFDKIYILGLNSLLSHGRIVLPPHLVDELRFLTELGYIAHPQFEPQMPVQDFPLADKLLHELDVDIQGVVLRKLASYSA